jgi:hypothetical protein
MDASRSTFGSRLGRHLRSNVVAYLALFVAMSGTAYATATIGSSDIKRDAVLSRHIKNGEIRQADLNNFAVTGAKVVNGSITHVDLKKASSGFDDVDADKFAGHPIGDFVRDATNPLQGSGDIGGVVVRGYKLDTTTSTGVDFSNGVSLQTDSVAGHVRLCTNTGLSYVAYIDGNRNSGTLLTGTCETAFNPGTSGDFQIYSNGTVIFGVIGAPNTFYVYGINNNG